ncbi:MAG TPA: 7-carboxy-7-deazaguanine synthase QueE [Chthoniobacteraceae bacterium]|nr:7-carboxy-7-deazaguanine synthase QueE [Chthoniobacteraceae bacterium]
MRIAEIFYSLQGEGELTGVPSVFVRTSGCNLRCTWCDTKYASWHPEGEQVAIDEIVDRVRKHGAKHVVLTGGEPMIAAGIHDLAAELRRHGLHITIETAGTIPPGEIACDLASLSPKLRNATPDADAAGKEWQLRHETTRWQPETGRAWIAQYDYQLKFVIEKEADIDEIAEWLRHLGREVPPWKVLLMPQAMSAESARTREATLLDLCKRHGYRYCSRLHIELFGNRRGT